jgi:hypothetical protein
LRKLIAELEIKVAAPSVPRDAATPPDGEPDRLGPAS